MTTETYKGFLIEYESLAEDAIAYRNDNFYRSSIPTYKGTVEEIKSEIDEKQDYGDFTVEQIAFMVIEQNPLNDAMIARLYYAAENKMSDLGHRLTGEELHDVVVAVTGWGVDTEEEAVLNAEAFSVLQDKFLLNDVPHAVGLTKGNGGGKEYEYFLATGKYLWNNTEYTDPPHQLEVDTGRGVIYLHNLMSGKTALRVCRVPDDLIRLFETGTVVIDLVHTPVRRGGGAGRATKKEPVFLAIKTDEFDIIDEAGLIHFTFKGVPSNLISNLWLGEFVDITLGHTGRAQ